MRKILVILLLLISVAGFSQREKSIPWLKSQDITNTRYFIWQGDTIDFSMFIDSLYLKSADSTDVFITYSWLDENGLLQSDSTILYVTPEQLRDSLGTLPGGHDPVTLATSATNGGLSLSTQAIGFRAANTSQSGYLTSGDWNTFYEKLGFVTHDATMTGNGTVVSPLKVDTVTNIASKAWVTNKDYLTQAYRDYDSLTNTPTIPVIENDAYGAGWDSDLDGASKNAIYDAIQSIGGGGATNLTYSAYPDSGRINSDTGTDAVIPAGSTVNASLMLPEDKEYLDVVDDSIAVHRTELDDLNDSIPALRTDINTNAGDISANADSLAIHLDTLQAHNLRLLDLEDSIPALRADIDQNTSDIAAIDSTWDKITVNDTLFIGSDTIVNNVIADYDSTGFRITESQISDLDHFVNADETDQVYAGDSVNIVWFSDLTDSLNVIRDTTDALRIDINQNTSDIAAIDSTWVNATIQDTLFLGADTLIGDPNTHIVTQTTHGLSVNDWIRLNGSSYVTAQADTVTNADVIGVVIDSIDANNFKYRYQGLWKTGLYTSGENYFLSIANAGQTTNSQTYNHNNVYTFLGTGTPDGLLIEIDIGEVIDTTSANGTITGADSLWVDSTFVKVADITEESYYTAGEVDAIVDSVAIAKADSLDNLLSITGIVNADSAVYSTTDDTLRIYSENRVAYYAPARVVTSTGLTTGLVSVWELDETSGTAVTDSHGSNNGTTDATVNQVGKIGTAYDFVSTSSLDAEVTYDASLAPSNWSLSIWVNVDNTGSDAIFQSAGGNSDNAGFMLYNSSITGYTFRWGNGTANDGSLTVGASSVGSWVHIVATYDGTTIKVYYNGSYVTEDSSVTFAYDPTPTDNPLRLGRTTGFAYLDGLIDQVALWSEALTPTEISTLYNSGNGLSYSSW